MKKVLLGLILGLTIVSCGGDNKTTDAKSESKTDSLEVVEEVVAEEEVVEEGLKWNLEETVDEFGDVSGSQNILQVEGTFSNSATQNSDLKVVMYDTDNQYMFMLFEYGSNPASLAYKDTFIPVTFKNENEKKTFKDGVFYMSKNKVCLMSKEATKYINKQKGEFKVLINFKGSKYLFEMISAK